MTERLFDSSVSFDPAGDPEGFLKSVPTKGAVYLFADETDRPVQLLCVGNLRQSLKRRLLGEEQVGPSRRVNYRDLVRRIHWRRVNSVFEADCVYFEAAREIYPQTYKGMVGFRPAWFVHLDPDAVFPRYMKTIDLAPRAGRLLGPFEDKHAAARWIQLVEDNFDLCRYHNILVESPRAKSCAYKEMGRCPAPCDGSVGMQAYRQMVAWSAEVSVNPASTIAQQTKRMHSAAMDLRFESAGRIKAYIDQLAAFGNGPFRHVRRLEAFRFVSIQRGPRAGTAKFFLIQPGEIREIAGVFDEAKEGSELLGIIVRAASEPLPALDPVGAERIGVVSHHLFGGKQSSGVFLPMDHVEERGILKALREVARQKPAEEGEGEGLVKELQSL